MLDCSQFLDDYSDFRDGLLSSDRMQSFRAHLASCSSCARYDRVIDQGASVFRGLPEVEPSADFVPRLQHRLYHVDEEMRRPGDHASGAPLAFTLAIAAIIGASAWMPTIRPRPEAIRLPPVAAHAPHRVEPGRVLFSPAPPVRPLAGQPATGAQTANLLFYRYSPMGSYVFQPTSLPLPQ